MAAAPIRPAPRYAGCRRQTAGRASRTWKLQAAAASPACRRPHGSPTASRHRHREGRAAPARR
eukprot:1121655-Prymnesium_polylepis.1